MKVTPTLLRVVALVNSAGFLSYLAWLVLRDDKILHAQDGILYVLPCVPFLFVFACLVQARRDARDAEELREND